MRTLSTLLCTLGALSFLSLPTVLLAGFIGTASGILSVSEGGNLWAFALTNIPLFGAAELAGLCLFAMGRLFARLGD